MYQVVFFRQISVLHYENRYIGCKRYMENSYISVTSYILKRLDSLFRAGYRDVRQTAHVFTQAIYVARKLVQDDATDLLLEDADTGATLLLMAARAQQWPLVRYLLDRTDADVDDVDRHGAPCYRTT